MNAACPQCQQPIDGILPKTYTVGWCQRDIHQPCFALHARTCAACRNPNEGWLAQQPLASAGPVR